MAKSVKHLEVEQTLSPELQVVFNELVLDYEESCVKHTSDHKKRVNYKILADLINLGWRK